MKTSIWTVDFDNGKRIYVSATTVLAAVKYAVWGYNKDSDSLQIFPKNIIQVRKGTF